MSLSTAFALFSTASGQASRFNTLFFIAFIVVSVGSIGCLTIVSGHAEAAAIAVSIRSDPPAHLIRPDLDLVRVTLTAEHEGALLQQGHVSVRIAAPPHPKMLSTDFPMVENTTLLDLSSNLQNGSFTFDYLFPIRGLYTFDINLTSEAAGTTKNLATIQQTFSLKENPAEIRNIWVLIIGLFGLGCVFGVIFSRSAAARDALPASAMVVLALLLTIGPAPNRLEAATQEQIATQGDWQLQVSQTPEQATVGEVVKLAINLTQDGRTFPHEVEINIVSHHEEDDKAVFQTQISSPQGQSSQGLQFFDGAPHQVTISVQPAGTPREEMPPLQVVLPIDVEGHSPPMSVKLRTTALLSGVIVIGMMAGFFLPFGRKEL